MLKYDIMVPALLGDDRIGYLTKLNSQKQSAKVGLRGVALEGIQG